MCLGAALKGVVVDNEHPAVTKLKPTRGAPEVLYRFGEMSELQITQYEDLMEERDRRGTNKPSVFEPHSCAKVDRLPMDQLSGGVVRCLFCAPNDANASLHPRRLALGGRTTAAARGGVDVRIYEIIAAAVGPLGGRRSWFSSHVRVKSA